MNTKNKLLILSVFMLLSSSIATDQIAEQILVTEQTTLPSHQQNKKRPSDGTIIIVHGTFAAKKKWHTPRGDFFKTLAAKNPNIISFNWSGRNNAQDRIEAGYRLAQIIANTPEDRPLTVVAHSHGGNIVSLATKFLYKPEQSSIDEAKIKQNYVSYKELFKEKAYDLIKAIEDVNELNNQNLEILAQKAKQTLLSTYKIYKNSTSSTLGEALETLQPIACKRTINYVFTLGTPVHRGDYNFNMDFVDECYALHSDADVVQCVGGLYKRKHKPQKKLLNVRVYIHNHILNQAESPAHDKLHAPHIGKHLLELPEYIAQALKPLTPENFDTIKCIDIIFDSSTTSLEPHIITRTKLTSPVDQSNPSYNHSSND